jgi:hypothetical protein
VQFNNNNIQPKVAGKSLRLLSNNNLKINNISILNDTKTTGYVLYADTDSSINTGDPSTLGFGFSTGDIKHTIKTTADTGWVMMDDGTIGNSVSLGTTLASEAAEDLFKLIWDNIPNSLAPVSTGRGASAQADFDVAKTITLPATLGRSILTGGSGASLTTRSIGQTGGVETHAITESEIPSHSHTMPVGTDSGGGTAVLGFDSAGTAATYTTNGTIGTGSAHTNVQPMLSLNIMIKL